MMTIGIAASSSPFDRDLFEKGIASLRRLGFGVRYRDDIFDEYRYLAGSDKRRAEELTELFTDESIDAIMFARGGYGSQRVIPLLDREKISRRRKPVIGFSDLTALLTWLSQACHVPTFYGPVMTQLGNNADALTETSLVRALTADKPLGLLPSEKAGTLKEGRAKGMLVGGCLSLITTSIKTPYEVGMEGSILFFEETGEKIYAMDRMLTQLKNAGLLKKVKGIVIGKIIPREGTTEDLHHLFSDLLADLPVPVVIDFPAGHTIPFVTLPLGIEVQLEASFGKPPLLTILEQYP